MKYRGGGYTLVEVLIFIALTSVLLVVAVSNISGNQRTTQFAQSIRDFESRINDVINDVPTGYFPTNDTIGCRVTAGGPEVFTSGTPTSLGGNNECLHVGKALQFAPDGNNQKVLIYTLAGRRTAVSGDSVKTIAEAEPIAVARPGDAAFNDSVQELNLRFGVRVRRVLNANTPLATYGIVGVLSEFEGSTPANGVSSAQAVKVGGIVGSSLNLTQTVAVNTYINSLTSDPPATDPGYLETASDGIVICLIDGDDRKASLAIGAGGSAGLRLDIDNYNVGCD